MRIVWNVINLFPLLALVLAHATSRRMNAVDMCHECRELAGRVGGCLLFQAQKPESSVEPINRPNWSGFFVALFQDVEGRSLFKSPSSRAFYLRRTCRFVTRHQYGEVYVDELKKTVSFDQDARRLDAFERELYSAFDLIVSDNYPVNVGS